ncbi:phage late control D family protein [Massilia dura]|uniref:Phage late control D family protein n=1 Tax=Pseudoduganella dura TaxID=321982 RepID=A0A6I3X3W7_9BURK|nr:phage late control D family protein [Pseudoduganella dura]MUI10917.1 phage late control D family protein [Pseudoduganella dura]GGY12814.1 bacteriophage late control gene D protein [Pseudoduganella dura]
MPLSPDFTVKLDGRDLTSKIAPRLIRLSIRECRADEADTLDLVLDDSDGKLAIPPRGAVLAVAIGWTGSQLVDKGLFTVNEAEHAGTPDTITLRARSASMTKGMGERREKSWHGQALADIVKTIAARHELKPLVGAALGAVKIDHVDQTHESDMAFLTRLAKRYDAVMTVKADNLLFVPIGQGTTASGKTLPVIALTRADGDSHRYHVSERETYSGVKAHWYSNGEKKRHSVTVGGETNTNLKVLPETYTSQAEAEAAAAAEFKRTQRSQATFALGLAIGRPELFPELPVTVAGWKDEIDSIPWLVQNVTHDISDGGYTNSIELEMRDDPASDKHRDNFRRGA